MLDFQQKRKIKSIFYHKATLIVLGIIVLLTFRSTWVVFGKFLESERQKEIVEKKSVDLLTRDKELQNKIEDLRTEHGIEEEIRTKFNVAKESENVVIIVDNNRDSKSTTTADVSFWRKIIRFLGGK